MDSANNPSGASLGRGLAPEGAKESKGWVIERHLHSRLHYWTGRPSSTLGAWSEKHGDALRLARRADAELMLTYHCNGEGNVVEHLWIADAASPGDPEGERRPPTKDQFGDYVCEHGTAMDVHCCHCHSGFIFDAAHECPTNEPDTMLPNTTLLTQKCGVFLSVEDYNRLVTSTGEKLLRYRTLTLRALQHLGGFTGISDFGEIETILLDDDRRWKEIKSGISFDATEEEKDWMVPLAHANHQTLGDWLRGITREKAKMNCVRPPSRAPPRQKWTESEEDKAFVAKSSARDYSTRGKYRACNWR